MKAELLAGFAALWLLAGSAEAAEPLPADLSFCVAPDGDNVNARDSIVHFGPCANSGEGRTRKIGHRRNREFTASLASLASVTKAIVAIHPAGSEPDAIYGPVIKDIDGSGLAGSVWIVAPQLLGKCEATAQHPCDSDVLMWSDDPSAGWGIGDTSVAPSDTQVSSFEVVDAIIKEMGNKAKNLREVVVIGFSRGARFNNRYSIGTDIDDGTKLPGVSFRYIIASQSSYFYLDKAGTRYTPNESGDSQKLSLTTRDNLFNDCKNQPGAIAQTPLNDYPYGRTIAASSDHYMKSTLSLSDDDFNAKVAKKKRLFLVGELDTDGGTTEKESGHCAAQIQGPHRRARAFAYMQHLRDTGLAVNANFCVIRDANHNAYKMASSYAAEFYWQNGIADCSLNDDKP